VPGLRQDVFLHDTLAALALPTPDFPADKPITWKQLAALPVVTVKPGYGVRRSIDAACESAGVQLQVAHEVSLLTTAVALAASGLGVAVVPASLLARGAAANGLVARRLTRPVVERRVAVVRKAERSLSPAAQAFAALLVSRDLHRWGFAALHRQPTGEPPA
jgi:DNA-binding transcriptional LysR family regulator